MIQGQLLLKVMNFKYVYSLSNFLDYFQARIQVLLIEGALYIGEG